MLPLTGIECAQFGNTAFDLAIATAELLMIGCNHQAVSFTRAVGVSPNGANTGRLRMQSEFAGCMNDSRLISERLSRPLLVFPSAPRTVSRHPLEQKPELRLTEVATLLFAQTWLCLPGCIEKHTGS